MLALALVIITIPRVSDTTGQLTAPLLRTRLADRPNTRWRRLLHLLHLLHLPHLPPDLSPRVAKASVLPGSPVIIASGSPGTSGHTSSSPLKDFLDSPATRWGLTWPPDHLAT